MKELIGNASNIYFAKVGADFIPNAEIVLILSEPQYRVDGTGQFIRERITETFRFNTNREGVLKLSEYLADLASEMETEKKA